MFYRTKDEKFLFKTILHPEVNVMMDLLQDYHKVSLNAQIDYT
jgi:hypothetical protein